MVTESQQGRPVQLRIGDDGNERRVADNLEPASGDYDEQDSPGFDAILGAAPRGGRIGAFGTGSAPPASVLSTPRFFVLSRYREIA